MGNVAIGNINFMEVLALINKKDGLQDNTP